MPPFGNLRICSICENLWIVFGAEDEESELIRNAIIRDLQRGVTVYKGRGGLSGSDQDILYCVVTRLEIGRVKGLVNEFDSEAFVVVHSLADAQGGVIKRQVHA